MIKTLTAIAVAVILFCACSVSAFAHHHHHHGGGRAMIGVPTATVHTSDHITTQVVAWARPNFQCLIDTFEGLGISVGDIGGQASGHMPGSKHHWGGAMDALGQTDFNMCKIGKVAGLCTNFVPKIVMHNVAEKCGLVSGCDWHHPQDCGHFEVPYSNNYEVAMRQRHDKYAIAVAEAGRITEKFGKYQLASAESKVLDDHTIRGYRDYINSRHPPTTRRVHIHHGASRVSMRHTPSDHPVWGSSRVSMEQAI